MKRRRKVRLPRDRDGTPVNIGDWLMFDDGPFHVDSLTYYGSELDLVTTNGWIAFDDNGKESDNIKAGKVISP